MGVAAWFVLAQRRHHAHWTEVAAVAWSLGAGFLSLAMLWLGALGTRLHLVPLALTLLALAASVSVFIRDSRIAGAARREPPAPAPERKRSRLERSATILLGLVVSIQVVWVVLVALAGPLHVWDSWVNWSVKARILYREGGFTPALYAEPARTATFQSYPLLLPLLEAWVFQWVGAPDDRMAGSVTALSFAALVGVCYAAVRRRGGNRLTGLAGATVVGAGTPLALLGGAGFADMPLTLFCTLSAVYLVDWLETGESSALALAAASAGFMPWTKREGLLLTALFCLASVILTLGRSDAASRHRGWIGAAAISLSALVLAGPWWAFVGLEGIRGIDFGPVTAQAFRQQFHRLPAILTGTARALVRTEWNLIWPAAGALLLWQVGERLRGRTPGVAGRHLSASGVLLLVPICYMGAVSLAYVFSAYVPYEAHVASSVFRLAAHIFPLLVLWVTYRTFETS
jgi:hypothetical protein